MQETASHNKSGFGALVLIGILSVAAALGWSGLLSWESPTRHLGRTLGVILPIAAALVVALWPRQGGRRIMLGILALIICGAAAFAAWWLVPTRMGLSRRSAVQVSQSLHERFQSLAPDAVREADTLIKDGTRVFVQFPGIAHPWQESLQGWRKRSLDHFVQTLDAIAIGDLQEYDRSSRNRERLKQACPEIQEPMERVERKWLRTTAAAAVSEVDGLVASDPQSGVARLKNFFTRLKPITIPGAAQSDVKQAKRRMMESTLNAFRARTIELIESRAYEDAMNLADSLHGQVLVEANDTGLADELIGFRDSCRYLVELARLPADPK